LETGPQRSIVLVGMMLSGKTTVGRLLASHLRRPFVDLDQAIAETEGQSVPEIFADSEARFRHCEKTLFLSTLSEQLPCVIATGGGAFEDPDTRSLALRTGFVVYLHAPAVSLATRYQQGDGRPLLDSQPSRVVDTLEALLLRRGPQYEQAHLTVSVVDRKPTEICLEIADALSRYSG